MSGDKSTPTKKKIVGLRTFADDVKRARQATESEETQVATEPAVQEITETKHPAPKAPTPPSPKPEAEIVVEKKITPPPPPKKSDDNTQDDNLGIEFENDPEIPPFHYVRASSPEETSFENAEEIPDKKSLQKKTISKKPTPKPEVVQEKISTDKLNLNDEISTVTNAQQAPEIGGDTNVLDVNFAEEGIGEGVIVTDQKRKRFKLFPAIAASVKSWFGDTKKDIKRAQVRRSSATAKVRKSSQRKDVIQKAAERTNRAPQNDYALVKERLKNVERNTSATTEFNIKKKDGVEEQRWTALKADDLLDSKSQEVLAETYSYDPPDKSTTVESIEELESMIRGEGSAQVYTKESFQNQQAETSEDLPEPLETVSPPRETTPPDIEAVPEPTVSEPTTSPDATVTGPAPIGYGSLPEYESEESQLPDIEEQAPEITPAAPEPSSIALEAEVEPEEEVEFLLDDVIARPREENTTQEPGGYQEYREQYGETYTPNEEAFLDNLSPQTEPAPVEPEPAPQLAAGPVPEERTAWAQQKQRTAAVQKQALGTPYLTLAAVVIAAILLGSGASVWWFTRDTKTVSTSPETSTQITSTVTLLGDARAFLTQVKTTATSLGTDTTYLTPVIGNTPATPAAILDTLQISADGSFTRNITNVRFGSNKNNPFVVLNIASFDTAFGGILLWESSIPKDLSPLFENAVQTAGKDIRISNNDARVLTDEVGREIVVYGFVDKQTILIAPTRDVFIEVLQSLR